MEAKEAKRLENVAKGYLKKQGCNFNMHFQVAHKGTSHAGNSKHWKEFLKGVIGEVDISCHER